MEQAMKVVSNLASANQEVFKYIPAGVVMGFLAAFVGKGEYKRAWMHEFVGTFLMIGLTFSPGKWIGTSSREMSWLAHAGGVVAADLLGGGPHVNPAVSVAMFSLGKCDYTECYVRIAGSMAAGLLAFPAFLMLSEEMGWTALGGPEYSSDDNGDEGEGGFFNEFAATFLLLVAIFVLNFELNFGKLHYWIKQPLTAVAIRALIECFPLSGPALNPMLGTAWNVFTSTDGKSFSVEPSHYLVYWFGPVLGALCASFLYVLYAGGTFFGVPIRTKAEAPAKKKNKKPKKE